MLASLEGHFPNSWEDISQHIDLFGLAKKGTGPLSLRQTLGLSQFEMGQALFQAGLLRTAPTRGTVCKWERPEQGKRLPDKYAMTDRGRESYRLLVDEIIKHWSRERLWTKAHMGKRRWRFVVRALCVDCNKAFTLKRARDVRCPRCINRRKKHVSQHSKTHQTTKAHRGRNGKRVAKNESR